MKNSRKTDSFHKAKHHLFYEAELENEQPLSPDYTPIIEHSIIGRRPIVK